MAGMGRLRGWGAPRAGSGRSTPMTGIRRVTRGAAVLGVAGLAAVASVTAAPAAGAQPARPARPGPPIHLPAHQTARPASAVWPSRTVLRESVRVRSATQVLSLARGADFAMVPVNRPETVFQLRRISLASGAVQSGPRL